MQFAAISIRNWRQFADVNIDLTSPMTVITGANGTGKTSILNLLSRHFGWNFVFVAAPYLTRKEKKRLYADVRSEVMSQLESEQDGRTSIGEVEYSDGSTCKIMAPIGTGGDNPQYQPKFLEMKAVVGLHVPSHRPPVSYKQVAEIPTNPKSQQQMYQEFQNVLFQSLSADRVQNPGTLLKQSLIALAVFGFGSEVVTPNQEYRRLFLGFQEVLRGLLPIELGFERIEVRMPDVVLVTTSGTFSLDAMSGGVSSIVGLAWQIFMYGSDKNELSVLIDEPENHLHPAMQRTLLPNLRVAFPTCRFVVATHSPFVITSDERASVYALKNVSDGVRSYRLRSVDLASTPDRVLADVLGVPVTVPVWVERRIREAVAKHSDSTIESARAILRELSELGYADLLGGFGVSRKDDDETAAKAK